jgi:hypothetical protein
VANESLRGRRVVGEDEPGPRRHRAAPIELLHLRLAHRERAADQPLEQRRAEGLALELAAVGQEPVRLVETFAGGTLQHQLAIHHVLEQARPRHVGRVLVALGPRLCGLIEAIEGDGPGADAGEHVALAGAARGEAREQGQDQRHGARRYGAAPEEHRIHLVSEAMGVGINREP